MRIRFAWLRLPRINSILPAQSLLRTQPRSFTPGLNQYSGCKDGGRPISTGRAAGGAEADLALHQPSGPRQEKIPPRAPETRKEAVILQHKEQSHNPSDSESSVPEIWMHRLDPFLPIGLRLNNEPRNQDGQADVHVLLELLQKARNDLSKQFGESVDLLTYMVVGHGRHTAVLHLVETLLRFAAASKAASSHNSLPSNFQWDTPYMNALSEGCGPIDVSMPRRSTLDGPKCLESQYEAIPNVKDESAALAHVWQFLGAIVVRSANSEPEDAQALLTIARRGLATVHHLDLIPDKVYSYSLAHLSSTLQRPPILHLLSSRILTTLSDAVWRAKQDEAISDATSSGVTYKQLGQDPPGGRFRLKVRDLGPEVWLELILWCCVEGGHETTGANIIKMLVVQTDDPWFAVRWTDSSDHQTPAVIDWDRVKMRTGGTVGRIEGYSSEEPLVNIPSRTISVEVVLALVESVLNSANLRRSDQGYSVFSNGKRICQLISFLEPHSLPPQYFDYLTLRMLQIEGLDLAKPPELLHSWARALAWLRSLEFTQARPPPSIDFRYQSVTDHNELQAGLLHQVLQAYLHAGYPNEAADVFNDIQQLVDSSKVQAIRSFISTPLPTTPGFFDGRPQKRQPDFVDSHGQLPIHRVAAFLNMVAENNMEMLGEWLLYSNDIDGPVIPKSAFGHPSIATALVRYGGESSDQTILGRVIVRSQKSRTRPQVKYLRARVNACIRTFDIIGAKESLEKLMDAVAGGYSADNLAHLAGALLRLEARPSSEAVANKSAQVRSLMQDILDGNFDGNKGTFYRTQITLFRQQIAHLLRIFDNLASPGLNKVSSQYMSRYPSGNAANLEPKTFDIILTAIVETRGAAQGMKTWEMFCRDGSSSTDTDMQAHLRDYFIPDSAVPFEDDIESGPDVELIQGDRNEDEVADLDVHEGADQLSESDAKALSTDADGRLPPRSAITFEADLSQPPLGLQALSTEPIQSYDRPNPVVVPSIKTLRIISRAALQQQRDGRFSNDEVDIESVIRWGSKKFRAFGRLPKRERLSPLALSDKPMDEKVGNQSTSNRVRERERVNVGRNFNPRSMTRVPWRLTGTDLGSRGQALLP